MASLGSFSIDVLANVAKFESDLGRANRIAELNAKAMSRDFQKMSTDISVSLSKVEKQSISTAEQIARIRNTVIGVFGATSAVRFAKELGETADQYANISAKIALVTKDSAELARTQEQVFNISQKTYSALDSTATLVSRTQRALVSNGASASSALSESLKLTETIQKAFAVSGATQQEASNAIIQLSQGLASGTLRGEEFNSISEQGSRITQALAKNLGVTTGELRAMAKEGRLTAEVIVEALSSEGAAINSEFEKLPLTIGRSIQLLDNAWTKYIGEANEAAGASAAVASAISGIGRNLDPIISSLSSLAEIAAVAFAGRGLQGIGAYSQGLVKAAAAQSALLEIERESAAASVEAARAQSIEIAATLDSVAAARQDVLATKALAESEILLAEAHLAASKAAGVQSFALREQAIAADRLSAAHLRQRAAVSELAVLGAQQARLQAGLAESAALQVSAQTRLSGALTNTQFVMQGLAKAGSALFTMIGGWPTVALAAAYGLYKMWEAMSAGDEQAKESTATLAAYNDQVRERIKLEGIASNFGVTQQGAEGISKFQDAIDTVARLRQEIEDTQEQVVLMSQRFKEGGDGAVLTMLKRIETLESQLREAKAEVDEFGSEFSNLPPVLQETINKVEQFGTSFARMLGLVESSDVASKIVEFSKETNAAIDSMNRQRETLGLTSAQLTMYNAELVASKESTEEGKKAIIDAARALADAQTAQALDAEAKKNGAKAASEYAKEAKKAAEEQEKLAASVASGQQNFEDMAEGLIQYADPLEEEFARFAEQIRNVGREAEDQAAKIEELRSLTGDDGAASEQLVELQNAQTDAINATTEAHERNVAAIMRENDVTGRYLEDLQTEAKLISMTNAQYRVESVVMRAVAEATAKNVAAGKELIKVDEARIRQQARMNEALSIAAQFNQQTGFEELVSNIQLVGEALEEAFGNEELTKPLEEAMGRMKHAMITGIVQSSQDGLRSLQSMAEGGSKAFQAMQIAIDALTVVQAISAVLNQGNGDPYTAFARMAAMAAAVASLVGSIGSFGGGNFNSSAESRQASQGTGTILGDAEAKSASIANAIEITADATSELVGINRGMLSALHSLQDALGAAGGMLARGAGEADFSGLNLAVGTDSFFSNALNDPFGWFGGSSEVTDQGIIIMGGALTDMINDIAVGAYQEVQSNSWVFGSTQTNEGIVDVSDEFGRQFSLIMESIADTVREGATALGILPAEIEAALAAYRVEEIRISLEDLSAEEQQAELEAVFSSIFDGLAADVVPFIEQFQQVGEGLGETLVRVATGVQVMHEAIAQLGFSLDETDPERFAQYSEALIGAVGGLDEFISGMQTFVSTFSSDAHQFEIASNAINSAFSQAGLAVPATADAFGALMQTLDATTEEGQEQIATLIRLSSAAKDYYKTLEEFQKLPGQLMEELGQSGGFTAMRSEIEAWERDTIASLNALGRAMGQQGAAEQDLVNVHSVAAQRIAQLIAKLKAEMRELAVTLGYTSQGDTLDSLNAQIDALGSASYDAAGAIGDAVDSMREKMNLLLGDLSPFNDQQKLELALQGLREGTVDPEQVLEIGRRLYASTSNYTDLFNQVMGIAQFGQPGGGGGGQSTAEGRTLAELIAARDALLAATRPDIADDLAHRIAEIAFATGDDFADIAAEQGFAIEQLGADLGLSGEALNDYLAQLVDQFESQDFGAGASMIEAAINNSADRIVEAITGKPIEAAIEASDERMADIAANQKDERAQSDQATRDAINGLTAAIISSGAADTDRVVEVLNMTRRDLRENFLGGAAGTPRGRLEPLESIR